eukprot:Gb_25478 [translate_table: standard]
MYEHELGMSKRLVPILVIRSEAQHGESVVQKLPSEIGGEQNFNHEAAGVATTFDEGMRFKAKSFFKPFGGWLQSLETVCPGRACGLIILARMQMLISMEWDAKQLRRDLSIFCYGY